jgi:hypothetical protein
MGVGVEQEKTFSSLWEDRLNASSGGTAGTRYEVLNFGVAGHTQIQTLGMVENEILEWSPNAVFYFEHGEPLLPTMRGVENYVRGGNMKHYDFLVNVARKAGVEGESDPEVITSRLRPYREEILSAIYRRIVRASQARNVPAVWVYLPRPEDFDKGPSEFELRLAREAGFEVVVLEDVYQTEDLQSLWVARWDHHPNAAGNKMIADRLFEAVEKAAIIPRTMSLGAQRSARHPASGEGVAR